MLSGYTSTDIEHAPRVKLASLQVIRGIAASMVVVHHVALATTHYGHRTSWIARSGLGALCASGVDLFFVISGFIMLYTAGKLRGTRDARSFLLRRSRRVFPLYWVWTTLLLVLWKGGILFTHTQYSSVYVLCSYLLWPIDHGGTFHPVLDQGWTLTFELFFYLIFSAAIALGSTTQRAALVFCGLIGCNAASHLLPPGSPLRYLMGNTLLVEFGLGMVAAVVVRAANEGRLAIASIRWGAVMLSVTGIVELLLSLRWGEPEQWRFLVWGVPSFCIVLGVLLSRVSTQHHLLLYLGDSSYSIYLGHALIVVLYATMLKRGIIPGWLPADLAVAVAATITITVSAASYKILEEPLLHILGNRERKLVVSSAVTFPQGNALDPRLS